MEVTIVGCGSTLKNHIRAWKKVTQATVVAVCDLDEQIAQNTAKVWRIPHYYTELSELLRNERVSVVDICTPPQTHLPLISEAIDSGCHVLVEKPFVLTTKEADEVIMKLSQADNLKFCVAHNILFSRQILKLRSEIEAGHIRDIVAVESDFFDGPEDALASDERHWCHTLPGGRFGENLPHPVYLLRHFLGPLQVEDVIATKKLNNHPWMAYDELEVILTAGPKLGRIRISYHRTSGNMLRIYTKEDLLVIRGHNQLVKFSKWGKLGEDGEVVRWIYNFVASLAKRAPETILWRRKTTHDNCIRLFAESIVSNIDPPVTIEEAYETVKIVEQICAQISG